MRPAKRLDGIQISLIRQINALATAESLNLGIGEPNVEPDDTLRAMAARAAARGSWHYSPNAGNLSLRKKIAVGTEFNPRTEVCVTAGTEEALYAIFQAYVNDGDEVLVPNPGFTSYPTLARICGATAVPYSIEPPAWKLDAKAVLSKITSKTKLIVVNSPSNPLGSIVDRETLETIASAGPLVVSDEIYREIWYDAPPPSMRGMRENVVAVDGMSKSHSMTGLRLGWIFAREEVMRPVITAHQYIATCASVFSQQLAEMILDAREWNASWLERVRAQFREQREQALASIERGLEAKIPPPAGAFYAFAPVPACDTESLARTIATDTGVLVIPGIAFGSAGEGFIRISFAAPLETIGAGIERV
ncbi:MAG TPA: pyridoxal phosphate-dependent aminotransferase, partial [Thermoanaerobaculia bacterium]|nr:pyridoxal phosphate-dependent aminotransferase [Thermoanaerobaculia bacterium]